MEEQVSLFDLDTWSGKTSPEPLAATGGRDFQAVLTGIARIAEPDAPDVPMPDKGGWPKSGCLYGVDRNWSISFRLHDAQFWGVPQRRKRIALVADFGGLSAPEILFEREGLSRDSKPGKAPGEEAARGVENGAYPTIAKSITRRYDGSPCIDRGPNIVLTPDGKDTAVCLDAHCANTPGARGGQERTVVCCYDARGNGNGETVPTLTGDHQNRVTDYTALCVGNGQLNQNNIVRRLTPLECERLQGYPDGWTDIGDWTDSKGKKHKAADSPRYKALGNSIALPFWQYLARRICAQYERDITMGSLFDGIGGFPLVFERCGAKAAWASEIEEFPIAVTKKHFPEVEP